MDNKSTSNDLNLLSSQVKDKPSWIKNGGYMFIVTVFHFFYFKNNDKNKNRNLDFEDIANDLLTQATGSNFPDSALNKTLQLLNQQRLLENTRARKRLEKWATKLIPYYLLAVLAILILNAVSKVLFNLSQSLISDTIITVILSTTTINIIGLGIIVLKGHFEKNNDDTLKSKNDNVEDFHITEKNTSTLPQN